MDSSSIMGFLCYDCMTVAGAHLRGTTVLPTIANSPPMPQLGGFKGVFVVVGWAFRGILGRLASGYPPRALQRPGFSWRESRKACQCGR